MASFTIKNINIKKKIKLLRVRRIRLGGNAGKYIV